MTEIIRLDQSQRRSRCVIHGNTVYLAGQVADDKSGDITLQTQQALGKIDQLLSEAGTDKRRMLTATIWLRDMKDVERVNAVWDAWVAAGSAPARCCGKVELVDPGYLIEIVVVAAA